MRRILFTVLLLGFILGNAHANEEVFEGRVKMAIQEGSTTHSIDYYVKGEQMRIETEDPRAQGGVMILDMGEKKLLMLMPQQQMYMTMELPDITTEATEENDKAPTPTGETREILGYTAKQYLVQDGRTEFEVWATDELGTFGGLHLPSADGRPGASSPGQEAMAGQDFFPLLIIERRNGQEATRIEVTEIEQKDLPESLFQAPENFRGLSSPFQLPR